MLTRAGRADGEGLGQTATRRPLRIRNGDADDLRSAADGRLARTEGTKKNLSG
jgi:hypothetical protein